MAKAKTGSFYIRRKVNCDGLSPDVVSIDTSAYVDPGDRQGVMIESVNFIFFDSSTNMPLSPSVEETVQTQLLTGSYTTMQPADEEDLIASAALYFTGASAVSHDSDVFPDVLGTGDGYIVVDDQLSLIGQAKSAFANATCAVLIKAKVVTLTNKDYMALAMQTVAN